MPILNRPNILLIHSDQHRFDCVGANGHPLLHTPNLDRLATEGMNFRHAFTPTPLCVPTRNSLLNGQWPATHHTITNFDTEVCPIPAGDQRCFSHALADAGYRLGYVGKWDVDREHSPTHYGFHDYVPEGEYGRWRAEAGLPPRPREARWFGETDPHITPEQSRLAWGTDQTLRLLDRYATADRPFFLRWDPSEPHLPNVVPEPYASMIPPETIPPWGSFPDEFGGKPYIQAQQRRTWRLENWTWNDWAPLVSRYLGEICLLDAQIGRILTALDRLGIADNTLVIYTADHGDMCGSHGMIDKHFIMYDDVVRVPLIMRWPACIPAGSTCDAFVCHALDLAQTFCEIADAPAPDTFQGRSLLPHFRQEADAPRRDDIFSTYHGNQFGLYSQRMVRNSRWKYVWNATAEDELYDLETDPCELRNRALDPDAEDALAHLRQRLVQWMEDTADPLLNYWTRDQISSGLTH